MKIPHFTEILRTRSIVLSWHSPFHHGECENPDAGWAFVLSLDEKMSYASGLGFELSWCPSERFVRLAGIMKRVSSRHDSSASHSNDVPPSASRTIS